MNDSSASPLPSDATASPAPDDPSEPSSQPSYSTPPAHLQIDHHDGLGQRCLKSLAAFEPGDVLSEFAPRRHADSASRMTVQISEHHHVELGPVYLELINHSCDPNVFFDSQRWQLVALKPIAPGDELCFFYPSTEWHLSSPFECACGSERCLGRITGASRISRAALSGHRLSAHIHRMLAAADVVEPADAQRDGGLFASLFART